MTDGTELVHASYVADTTAEIIRLKAEVAALREALERIASWSEGPEVTGSFDEPESAKIARAALGSERPAERDGTVELPAALVSRLIDMHQDAADALVDAHGDPHREIVAELRALSEGPARGHES